MYHKNLVLIMMAPICGLVGIGRAFGCRLFRLTGTTYCRGLNNYLYYLGGAGVLIIFIV